MMDDWKDAAALVPGESFYVQTVDSNNVTVTVLRGREPCEDGFGRAMIRYWCRREDTGKEGWMVYGPGGRVRPYPYDNEEG